MTAYRKRNKQPSVGAHYMVRFVSHMAAEQKMPIKTLAEQAGVAEQTIRNAFNNGTNISIASLEALLNTLGYRMGPVRI